MFTSLNIDKIGPFLLAFWLTVLLCFIVQKSPMAKWISHTKKPHWIHRNDTVRLGGFAIICVVAGSQKFSDYNFIISALLISGIPLLVVGLIEDFGKEFHPKFRLVFCFIAPILAIFLLNTCINRVNVPYIDVALSFSIVAFLITVGATMALSQAYNLIDGLNGLSAGFSIISLTCMLAINQKLGQSDLVLICALFIATISGFWLVNILTGRIFLGDSGAYFVGFVVAWLAILTTNANPTLSAWAILLSTIHPVIEIFHTIFRRVRFRYGVLRADKKHMHHLVKKLVDLKLSAKDQSRNSLSSLIILSASLPAAIIAFNFYDNTLVCTAFTGLFALVYFKAYSVLDAKHS